MLKYKNNLQKNNFNSNHQSKYNSIQLDQGNYVKEESLLANKQDKRKYK